MTFRTPHVLLALVLTASVAGAYEACPPSDCNDGNLCTTDACVGGFCTHTPNIAACGPLQTFVLRAKKLKLRIPPSAPDRNGVRMLVTEGELKKDNLPKPFEVGDTFTSDPYQKGGSLRIFTNMGDHFDKVYPLPSEGPVNRHWEYYPLFTSDPDANNGYQYKDAFNDSSPIGVVKIIAGTTMKLKGKDNMAFTLNTDPRPVNVVLTLGNYKYCFEMNGGPDFRSNFVSPKIVWAKNADAPPACPCNQNADCDDGDAGNGSETCVGGYCQ